LGVEAISTLLAKYYFDVLGKEFKRLISFLLFHCPFPLMEKYEEQIANEFPN